VGGGSGVTEFFDVFLVTDFQAPGENTVRELEENLAKKKKEQTHSKKSWGPAL
jgi:hypothetical protein